MGDLSVTVDGLDDLMQDVQQAGGNAERLVTAAIVNSTNKVQSLTRSLAPHRTGTLQRSILTDVQYPIGTVSVGEKYGAYLEGGTGIYAGNGVITPKQAKVLAFSIGGKAVFARSIKGMKARPFFRPGVEQAADYISDQFTTVIEKITSALAGKGF